MMLNPPFLHMTISSSFFYKIKRDVGFLNLNCTCVSYNNAAIELCLRYKMTSDNRLGDSIMCSCWLSFSFCVCVFHHFLRWMRSQVSFQMINSIGEEEEIRFWRWVLLFLILPFPVCGLSSDELVWHFGKFFLLIFHIFHFDCSCCSTCKLIFFLNIIPLLFVFFLFWTSSTSRFSSFKSFIQTDTKWNLHLVCSSRRRSSCLWVRLYI